MIESIIGTTASTILSSTVTGASVASPMQAEELIFDDSVLTASMGSSLTTIMYCANELDQMKLDTAQAVNYIESYTTEDAEDLVCQIDNLLSKKPYTKTLKK